MAEFFVDRRTDAHTGHVVYQVWQSMGDGAEDVLVGEYDTMDAARAAMNAAVADPDREPHPGLGTTDTEPVEITDEEEYPAG